MSRRNTFIIVTLVAVTLAVVAWLRLRDREAPAPIPGRHDPTRPRAGSGVEPRAVELAKVRGRYSQRGVEPRRIAGRVTLAGKPYAGARVSLQWTATETAVTEPPSVTTDAAGRFDLGTWFAERYTVTAAGDASTTAAVVELDLRDPMLAPPPDDLELKLVACDHVLFGTVFDGSGGPVVGAHVAPHHAVGATADGDGNYTTCLPAGRQVVYVMADGYGRLVVTVDLRGRVRRDVLLVPAGAVSGQIVRKRDRSPVAAALVSAWPVEEGPSRAAEVMTHTTDDGRFALKDLVPGRYTIWVSTGLLQGSSTVLVTQGKPADVVIAVADRARVSGTITADGKPLGGATIYARAVDRADGSPPSITQLDGTFVLDEVPLGDVTMVVVSHEVVTPTRVKVDREEVTGVAVTVARMASISGTVMDGGAPASGAMVSSMRGQQATTGADGRFRIAGLVAGRYDLRAESFGVGAAPWQTVEVARGEQRTGVVFELTDRASIEGTVVDQNNAPVPDVTVTWTHAVSGTEQRGKADDRGSFKVDMLEAPAAYRASVRTQPSEMVLSILGGGEVTIAAGQPRVEGVRLQVRAEMLSISGKVVDPEGNPVADARIDALGAPRDGASVFYSWLRLPSTVSAENGTFKLARLAAGSYAVRARGTDESEAIVPVVAAGARDVVLQLKEASRIEVALVRFAATPAVDAQNTRGDFKSYYASVDGNRAVLVGLPPGRYIVTAHTSEELDAAMVDVSPGAATRVTLTSRGTGRLSGRITRFPSANPIADMTCLMFPRVGGVLGGVPVWDMAVAPRSNAQGEFRVDAAPAGQSAVYCYGASAGLSSARAFVALERGQVGTAELAAVQREQPANGDIGFDLDQGYPLVVNGVRNDGPAAVAGIRTGDQLVALAGHPVDGLSKGGVLAWIANQPIKSKIALTIRRGAEQLVIQVVVGHTLTP